MVGSAAHTILLLGFCVMEEAQDDKIIDES